jgi:hypothetical protein
VAPGDGFTLVSSTGQVALLWQVGAQADGSVGGFRVVRMTSGTEATAALVGAATTSAVDILPAGVRTACYRLEVLDSSGSVQRVANVLCLVAGTSFGVGPNPIAISYSQPGVALVAWNPVPGAAGYFFLPLGSTRSQLLATSTPFAFDTPGSALTCYAVATSGGTSITGLSDIVCGLSFAGAAGSY